MSEYAAFKSAEFWQLRDTIRMECEEKGWEEPPTEQDWTPDHA